MTNKIDDKTAALLEARGSEYGQAWLVTTLAMQMIGKHYSDLHVLRNSVFFYNWITILCKLVRACATPNNRDHWADIAGYATLCVNYLDDHKN